MVNITMSYDEDTEVFSFDLEDLCIFECTLDFYVLFRKNVKSASADFVSSVIEMMVEDYDVTEEEAKEILTLIEKGL